MKLGKLLLSDLPLGDLQLINFKMRGGTSKRAKAFKLDFLALTGLGGHCRGGAISRTGNDPKFEIKKFADFFVFRSRFAKIFLV